MQKKKVNTHFIHTQAFNIIALNIVQTYFTARM